MAETTSTKPYDVKCPDCGEEFEADIPLEALQPGTTDQFTVDCPDCEIECLIVYDAAKDAVGLTCEEDEEEDDEEDVSEDDDEEEDEEEV